MLLLVVVVVVIGGGGGSGGGGGGGGISVAIIGMSVQVKKDTKHPYTPHYLSLSLSR